MTPKILTKNQVLQLFIDWAVAHEDYVHHQKMKYHLDCAIPPITTFTIHDRGRLKLAPQRLLKSAEDIRASYSVWEDITKGRWVESSLRAIDAYNTYISNNNDNPFGYRWIYNVVTNLPSQSCIDLIKTIMSVNDKSKCLMIQLEEYKDLYEKFIYHSNKTAKEIYHESETYRKSRYCPPVINYSNPFVLNVIQKNDDESILKFYNDDTFRMYLNGMLMFNDSIINHSSNYDINHGERTYIDRMYDWLLNEFKTSINE